MSVKKPKRTRTSKAALIAALADGRTDRVFDLVAHGHSTKSRDGGGVSLLQWCAYYGDVSAMRFLLDRGEDLLSLGPDLGIHGAAFHGHWRLCQFLLENGARSGWVQKDTGETPLHSALCTGLPAYAAVVRVLLAHGADPNAVTRPGVETGAFMRDSRTRGETPLHRAAAFACEEAVDLLLEAGADPAAKDASGDSPLSWASWHLRPASILRKLCYAQFRVQPQYAGMEANLRGRPHV